MNKEDESLVRHSPYLPRLPRHGAQTARLPLPARSRVPASAARGGQREGRPQGDAGAQGALGGVPRPRHRDGHHQVRPVSFSLVTITYPNILDFHCNNFYIYPNTKYFFLPIPKIFR